MTTKKKTQGVLSKDELDIRKLIELWAKAVRDGDRTGIRTDHVPDILMFDVQDSLQENRNWYGKWIGAVRPSLAWQTELVEASVFRPLSPSLPRSNSSEKG